MDISKEKAIKILLCIIALAAILRTGYVLFFSSPELSGDPYYYDRTAQYILIGDGYRNGNLYAYLPPLYAYFLAGIYSLFGHTYIAVKIVQIIISIATCYIIYLLATHLINRYGGIIASFLFACYPQFIRYPGELWTETLFIFIFLTCILLTYKYMASRNILLGIFAGILLGLSSLTREIALLFIIPMALWFLIMCHNNKMDASFVKYFGIFFIATALTIFPWTLRNYLVFGRLIPISTNGGVNFYIGNNPAADGGFNWRIPDGTEWPDNMKNASQQEWNSSEIQILNEGLKQGVDYIRNNPLRVLRLYSNKFFFLWRPPYYEINISTSMPVFIFRILWLLTYLILIGFAIPGMIVTIVLARWHWLLLHFWVLHVTAIHMLTYGGTRYRLPAIPILILFSVFVICILINRNIRRKSCHVS